MTCGLCNNTDGVPKNYVVPQNDVNAVHKEKEPMVIVENEETVVPNNVVTIQENEIVTVPENEH
jgi:hypothetical protein